MKVRARPDGPTALDLIEEATHLVRCVPLAGAAAYALGVVPFVLGATFFVADMSRGAHAAARLPGAAIAMVLAFAWMKTWQAVAAEQALAFLEQRVAPMPGFAAWIQLALRQFSLHAFGLLLLPLAAVFLIPSGWVYAYYQNVTVLGLSEGARTHRVAVEQARLWPAQNHGALGSVSVLAILVLGNVGAAIYTVPWLLRTITGTERMFAQTGWNPLNTTFLAAVFALSFLVLDPVLKAFYVLRCFYGRSRRTGVDLLVQVRASLGRAAMLACASLLALAAASDLRAQADDAPEPKPASAVERADAPADQTLASQDLDQALDRVLEKPDYVWREAPPKAEGAAADFAKWLRGLADGFARWWRGLFDSDDEDDVAYRGSGFLGFSGSVMMWLFLIAAVILIAFVIATIIRRSEGARRPAAGAVAVTRIALDRDDVTADQLEEEEWMRLARELIARGEVRLGMRALFLGSLAGLAGRGYLVLARHKSNRDYERELLRRGAPLRALVAAYVENRREFEGVWYGSQSPDAATITRFEDNVRLLVRKEPA